MSTADTKIATHIIDNILNHLSGDNTQDILYLPNFPHRIYIIGSLSERDESLSGENKSSIKSNSICIEFLSSNNNLIIRDINISFSLFYGLKMNAEELTKYDETKTQIPYVWKKIDLYNTYSLSLEKKEQTIDFSEIIEQISQDKNHYYDTVDRYNWAGKLLLECERYTNDIYIYKIYLINETSHPSPTYETSFINCKISFPIKEEYELISFPLINTDVSSLFKTRNCGYIIDGNIFSTTPYKLVKQDKIIPKDSIDTGEKPSFLELSQSIEYLEKLREYLWSYIIKYDVKHQKSEELLRFKSHFFAFEKGLELLKSDALALKAFYLMNRTFYEYTRDKSYNNWRLFQLSFILSTVPDIVNPTSPGRDSVELLHIDTGGGKSEAYFGLVLFTAFYDRLRGKQYGVSAITKFPLRMLSIDQLKRISNIFAFAERIRINTIHKEGDRPFSVAYYVGNSEEFPRNTFDEIEKIKSANNKGCSLPGKIIESCPFCKNRVVLSTKPNRSIVHICCECNTEFNIYYTDEEIFRFLPTFIVSTVDKFAGLSGQRRVRNLFGGELHHCSDHGFFPANDFCEVGIASNKMCKAYGEKVSISFSTAPTLVIQDELHLLREGFGAINSHFETFLENLTMELNNGIKFKHITMTATAKGAESQIRALYCKDITNIFSNFSPCGKGVDDPFFWIDRDIPNRFIVGLKPNFRDNQYATLLTLRYLVDTIQDLEENEQDYSARFEIPPHELRDIVKKYKTCLTYHTKKSDVNSMSFFMNAVVNSKLINYHLRHHTLSGENSLDNIKEQMLTIENFDLNGKQIDCLSCTSIVSHGVDITRWNVMCFQGIPRSTSEYIQAMSRVGRKDIGIIFMWFYPNRVRDVSYYDNFYEFHKKMEDFIESVPIERWTKLGFNQTFHSIFCGAILNYMSAIKKQSTYSVDNFKSLFFTEKEIINDENVAILEKFIQNAYRVNYGKPNSNFLIEGIIKGINERIKYIDGYVSESSMDPNMRFFPNVLSKNDNMYWNMQYGMRGIQYELELKIKPESKIILDVYE